MQYLKNGGARLLDETGKRKKAKLVYTKIIKVEEKVLRLST